jgi:hypothetical protein
MDLSAGKKYAKKLAPEPTPDAAGAVLSPAAPTATPVAVHAVVGTAGTVRLGGGADELAVTSAPAPEQKGPPPVVPLTLVASDARTPPAPPAAAPAAAADASREGERDPAAVMQAVLMGLPEPPRELADALAAGLTGAQLTALLERLWAARQVELADAIAAMRTEGETMAGLLRGIVNGTLTGPARLSALADLEYAVSQVHNAEDFAAMGGVALLTQLLNGTNPSEVAAVAWTLGSALKYAAKVQAAAARHGTAVALLSTITRGLSASTTDAAAADWVRVTGKALYALAALLRGNAPAQSELRGMGAGHVLLATVRGMTAHLLDADPSSAVGSAMLGNLRRVWGLLSDLHTEAVEREGGATRLAPTLLSHDESAQW